MNAAHWIDVPRLAGASPHQAQALDADLAFAHPAIAGVDAIDRERGRVAVRLAPGTRPSDDVEAQVRAAVAASLRSLAAASSSGGMPSRRRAVATSRPSASARWMRCHKRLSSACGAISIASKTALLSASRGRARSASNAGAAAKGLKPVVPA